MKYYNSFEFDDLAFNPAILPTTAETNVEFSFNIPQDGLTLLDSRSGDEQCIIVTLENLTKADDEDRLNNISAADGKSFWKFNPTHTSENLKLKTTTANATRASVSLSAYHFEDAEEDLEPWTDKIIGAGRINVGNDYMSRRTDYKFTLYTQNPGTSSDNPGNNFYNFTVQRNYTNPAFTIDYDTYQALMDDKKIYVRFKGNDDKYHVTTVDLETLLNTNQNVTLTFN